LETLIIDAYCHILPSPIAKTARHPKLRSFAGIPQFVDPDQRLKHMEKYGVDVQVLSLVPTVLSGVEISEAIPLCQTANDAIAQIARTSRGRFEGIASVPLPSIGEALDELDRAVNELNLHGVQIFSNIHGRPLDSEEFFPFYERVLEHDVPILIHPVDRNGYELIKQHRLNIMLGWPFDTSLAMVSLVQGGVFDRYPSLKILTHHLGAMIPYFMGRVNCESEPAFVHYDAEAGVEKPLVQYFKKFYADTAVDGWHPALNLGYSFFGPEKTVFSTDYPFGPEGGELFLRELIRGISDMSISEEEKHKIFEDNAKKLFKLG